MTETDVAAYKEQVFGNGQSSTHAPTQPPTNDTPSAEQVQTTTVAEPVVTTTVTPNDDEDEIVDADEYIPLLLKENLGVSNWDEAKSALSELKTLKETASTPYEIKFANEQSKQLHEAIIAGETEKVYEILDTQKKIAAVEKMKPADAIKLHIQINNKNFRPIDIEDVFEEKYTYPEKPVQGEIELDNEFEARQEKWKATKEKIDRKIERDSEIAKSDLQKLHAELKLPEIPKPVAEPKVDEEAQANLAKAQKEAIEFYSKLSPKDIQMVFKFNDEANKLAFDIQYEPDKDSFEDAIANAKDPDKFWGNYYNEDGSPDRIKFLKDLHNGRNISKIVSEAIVQAVNQERIRSLKSQKNIGDGTQRNFVVPPVSEIEQLKQAVFGN